MAPGVTVAVEVWEDAMASGVAMAPGVTVGVEV